MIKITDTLRYSITGLEDYVISFGNYCSPCEIQRYCTYGKENPFTVAIRCTDLNEAKEKVKLAQLQTLQKKLPVETTYEELMSKVDVNEQEIYSEIWQNKIKADEEIRCLNSDKWDPLLVTQRGQDWWRDFSDTIKVISEECEKIV
ncbi:MAG: hypothetical protein EU544_04960 [Promethearchaeota archaeon]|nr:MAG: hypothetical protein EU544_04960 [Candidatus Lokiarchaeota archaeon]